MKTIISLFAASALGLSACGPKTENRVTEIANDTSEVAPDVGNTTSNAFQSVERAIVPAPTAQGFVDKALKSDVFEIAAAKLATDNAASTKVKNFAREMIGAHTESTAKIEAAARKAMPAIVADPTLTSDQNEKLAELGKLKGIGFDKQYVAGQIEAHDNALTLMQGYAKDGDIAPLKAVAGEIVPIVQKHLERAKALVGE